MKKTERLYIRVAAELHYSERQCRRIGEVAINKMIKVLKTRN